MSKKMKDYFKENESKENESKDVITTIAD